MKNEILRRLEALEGHTKRHPVPSEPEFWELWNELDELNQSLLVSAVENRSDEEDPDFRKFLFGISGYLFDADLADPHAQTLREMAHEMDTRGAYDIEA